jgi:hypothetical protein
MILLLPGLLPDHALQRQMQPPPYDVILNMPMNIMLLLCFMSSASPYTINENLEQHFWVFLLSTFAHVQYSFKLPVDICGLFNILGFMLGMRMAFCCPLNVGTAFEEDIQLKTP